MQSLFQLPKLSLFALAAATLALPLTGCGIGPAAAPTDTVIASLSGNVHGGYLPIQGARVILYHTTSTGYGAGAVVIGTAVTDGNGSFTISPSATVSNCPAGQQAYITSAGGYESGQNTNDNTNSLEIAALGPCSGVSSSTYVSVNEVTTVAAGFALSGFLTTAIDGTYTDGLTNPIYAANIGAPAANNALTTAITATNPAGLAHAFSNAAALANTTTGQANTSFTAYTGGTTTTGAVPQAMINALADALQACIDGASSPGNVSSNCSTLFADTISLGGNTPTNTLQAMAYLARNPYTAAGINGTTGLDALGKGIGGAFSPALSSAPPDWSMAILYHNGLPAPYFVALDANDTAYLGLSTTSASTPALFGISSYGVNVPTFASRSAGTASRGIAPDALGNIWLADNNDNVDRFSTSTGALEGTFVSAVGSTDPVAVDAQNNMWVGHVASGTGVNIEGLVYSAAGPTWTLTYQASPGTNTGAYGLAVDANQNIWTAGYYSVGTTAVVIPNTGSVGSPSYAGTLPAVNTVTTTTGTQPYGLSFDASGNAWYDIYSGGSTGYVQEVTTTGSPITALNAQTGISQATLGTQAPLEPEVDGAGTMFIPDNASNGIHMYGTTNNTVYSPTVGLRSSYESVSSLSYSGHAGVGCTTAPTLSFGAPGTGAAATVTITSGAITAITITNGGTGYYYAPTVTISNSGTNGCTTQPVVTAAVATVYNPRQVAIDSTGSIWTGFTTGGATEIIGVAAPSYPLLSTGKPGLSPGLSAINPLP